MITVVSGLPRSGTSLMMQMLEAGGLPILTDNIRKPDENNPKGYYEMENVKKLSENNSWLADAENKAVKIISMLLYNLPANHQYKIIFMTRNMEEILSSQKSMLKRLDKEPGPPDTDMRSFFENHLKKLDQWLKKQTCIKTLYCNYNKLLEKPDEAAKDIMNFLNIDLDLKKMTGAVDKSLHRHNIQSE